MDRYKYRAINANGRPVRGLITASGEADLYNQLQQAGLELVSCSVAGEKSGGLLAGLTVKKVEQRELVQLFIQMEQLQSAGVPLLETLEDVRDTSDNPRLKDIMTDIHRYVTEGLPLSESMARHPSVFPVLHTSLIQAGEETGDITAVYRQLIKYISWTDDLQRKIKKATVQPKIAGGAVVLMTVVMLGHVVPEIVGFISNLGQALPFYTIALIATSEFFQNYWQYVLFVPIALFYAIKIMKKLSGRVAYYVDYIMLNMPLIGELTRKASIARYAQTFAALYSSGIDVLRALQSAKQTITNQVLVEGLDKVEEEVNAGRSLSEAFDASGQFPSLVVRMLKVGESSGNLSPILMKVSDFYSRDVDDAVEGLVGMIQPLLTGVMGGLILWIAISVFGPIYSSFENINF